jgi:hypothetical protein
MTTVVKFHILSNRSFIIILPFDASVIIQPTVNRSQRILLARRRARQDTKHTTNPPPPSLILWCSLRTFWTHIHFSRWAKHESYRTGSADSGLLWANWIDNSFVQSRLRCTTFDRHTAIVEWCTPTWSTHILQMGSFNFWIPLNASAKLGPFTLREGPKLQASKNSTQKYIWTEGGWSKEFRTLHNEELRHLYRSVT